MLPLKPPSSSEWLSNMTEASRRYAAFLAAQQELRRLAALPKQVRDIEIDALLERDALRASRTT